MNEKPIYDQLKHSVKDLEEKNKKLELDLIRSEGKYERMLATLTEEFYSFSHDPDGKFNYVSPSITHILGYTPEEYIGKAFTNTWTSNPVNEKADLHTRLSIQGHRQPPYEMEIYHKNGSYRRFVTIETPIFDSDGKVIAVEGTARNITDKRKNEEKLEKYRQHLEDLVRERTIELQNSQKQLFDIIDFLPDPTYVVDQKREIIAWNKAMEKMLGINKKEIIGKLFYDVIPNFYQSDDPLLIDLIWKKQDSCKAVSHIIAKENKLFSERYIPDLYYSRSGGYVWVTATPILDNESRIVGAIESIRDVTQIKEAERKIQESERRLSTLMGNLPGMAYRIVKQGGWHVEFVSSGCESIFGYKSDFFIDRGFNQLKKLIYHEDLDRIVHELKKAVQEKKTFQTEYRIITSRNEEKWVFDRAEALFNDNGQIAALEGFVADFTVYKNMENKLRSENIMLRSSIRDRYKFDNIIGTCEVMQEIYELIMKAAISNDSVFIYGESGTGKELVAHAIHKAGPRSDKKFVAVNCGAIPENLIESEFFGAGKGAYTGANADKKGYFEAADGGTLFLDEIGEISASIQVKLLRAIEGSGFSPVGTRKVIRPDVRIVAASNKDITELAMKGQMRQDFFFRIHVIPVHLPPLRERGDDIFLLIDHFLKNFSTTDKLITLNREDLEILKNYHWPGNIRELQNVLRRYAAFKNLDFMKISVNKDMDKKPESLEISENDRKPLKQVMEEFEKNYIQNVLSQNRWHKTKSAQHLGISRKTLFRKMKNHDLL